MKLLTECASPECLHGITNVIHDCQFNVDEVSLDPALEIVRVPLRAPEGVLASWFSFLKRNREPRFLLEVGKAKSMDCKDTQGICTYNINYLEYHSAQELLNVRTGIPTTFEIHIKAVDIRVYTYGADGRAGGDGENTGSSSSLDSRP